MTLVIVAIAVAAVLVVGLATYFFGPGRRHHVVPPSASAPVDERAPEPAVETPPPSAGRMVRLRGRLSGSQSTLGRGLLELLARNTIDDAVWDDVEEILLTSDVGVGATHDLVDRLRERVRVLGTRSPQQVHDLLRA